MCLRIIADISIPLDIAPSLADAETQRYQNHLDATRLDLQEFRQALADGDSPTSDDLQQLFALEATLIEKQKEFNKGAASARKALQRRLKKTAPPPPYHPTPAPQNTDPAANLPGTEHLSRTGDLPLARWIITAAILIFLVYILPQFIK